MASSIFKMFEKTQLFSVVLVCSCVFVDSIRFSMEKLSPWQLATIEEMRRQVEDELPHDYMKDDVYLARWLTSTNFHVDDAIELMRKNFKWRKQHNMDSILREDWTQMETEFPYQMDTFDKHGRPLLYINMGAWNVGRMSNAMRLNQLARYFSMILEEAEFRVRRRRGSGRDITQMTVLVNMDGYSLRKHACFHCFSFYSNLGSTLQTHYPRSAEKVVFVNAPGMFTFVFDGLQRMLNLEGTQTMELFGTDRNRWQAYLKEYVQKDQFPRDLQVDMRQAPLTEEEQLQIYYS